MSFSGFLPSPILLVLFALSTLRPTIAADQLVAQLYPPSQLTNGYRCPDLQFNNTYDCTPILSPLPIEKILKKPPHRSHHHIRRHLHLRRPRNKRLLLIPPDRRNQTQNGVHVERIPDRMVDLHEPGRRDQLPLRGPVTAVRRNGHSANGHC